MEEIIGNYGIRQNDLQYSINSTISVETYGGSSINIANYEFHVPVN